MFFYIRKYHIFIFSFVKNFHLSYLTCSTWISFGIGLVGIIISILQIKKKILQIKKKNQQNLSVILFVCFFWIIPELYFHISSCLQDKLIWRDCLYLKPYLHLHCSSNQSHSAGMFVPSPTPTYMLKLQYPCDYI